MAQRASNLQRSDAKRNSRKYIRGEARERAETAIKKTKTKNTRLDVKARRFKASRCTWKHHHDFIISRELGILLLYLTSGITIICCKRPFDKDHNPGLDN